MCSIWFVIVIKNFKDLIFMDGKLPMKTAKIMSLENLCIYNVHYGLWYTADTLAYIR